MVTKDNNELIYLLCSCCANFGVNTSLNIKITMQAKFITSEESTLVWLTLELLLLILLSQLFS